MLPALALVSLLQALPPDPPPAGFKVSPQVSKTIEARIAPLRKAKDFAGVIFVAQAGKPIFAKAYGEANQEFAVRNTLETRFLIGSITKQFTAAGILILQDRGQLKLLDTLDRFLPGFPKGDKITLRHLLTHTSGVSRDLPTEGRTTAVPHTAQELVEIIQRVPLTFEPGTHSAYSNNGYRLLAHIIEKVSGESYGEFLRKSIFEKLDMQDTGNADDQDMVPRLANGYSPWIGPERIGRAALFSKSNQIGAGSLYSTVGDLYKWDRSFQGNRILSDAAKAEMLDEKTGFGTGIFHKFGRLCIGHDGVGFGYTGFVERYPADDISIIYLGNVETGGSIAPLREAITTSVFGQACPPLEVDDGASGPAAHAADYLGRYEVFPGLVLEVKTERGFLLLGAGEGDYPLEPRTGDTFFYRLKYARVQFTRNAAGKVDGLQWIEGKNTYPCRRL